MAVDFDKLQYSSIDKIDKVVGTFDPIITTFNGSSTFGNHPVTNPYGQKALPTMMWSIDGVNFYEPRLKFPLTGGPTGVTVGVMVSADYVTFYYTNFTGSPVSFTVRWVLDFIDSDTP